MRNEHVIHVNVYVGVKKEKTVADVPVTDLSLEDIIRLEDECTVTLGIPTGVLGPLQRAKAVSRAAKRRPAFRGAPHAHKRAAARFKRAVKRSAKAG